MGGWGLTGGRAGRGDSGEGEEMKGAGGAGGREWGGWGAWRGKQGVLEVPIPLSTSPQVLAAPCSPHPLLFPPLLGSHPSLHIPQVLAAPHPLLFPPSWRFPFLSPHPPGPGSSLLLPAPHPLLFPPLLGSHPSLYIPQVLAAPHPLIFPPFLVPIPL